MFIILPKAIAMSVTYSPLHGTDADDTLSPTYDVVGDVVDVHTTIYGGGGNDTIKAEEFQLQKSRYAFYGEAGDDTLRYDNQAVQAYFSGGDGNDTIHVTGPLQSADGGANDDIIIVKGKTRHVDGGDGYDTLSASSLTISETNVSGFEKLILAGNVTLDQVNLGSFDKIVFEETTVTLTLTLQTDLSAVDIETTSEGYVLLNGSSESDRLDGSRFLGDFDIFGGAGDDYIKVNNTAGIADGEAGNDIVIGGHGNDTLSGGGSSPSEIDTVLGYGGKDDISYSGGGGVIDGGDGEDTLLLSSNKSGLHMGGVKITNMEVWDVSHVRGPLFLDSLDSSGLKTISGPVRLVMGDSSVFQNVDYVGSLTLTGTERADTISIARADGGTFLAGDGDDNVSMKGASNVIRGGNGNDTLTGLTSSDSRETIKGGDGDDIITGGKGKDDLWGDAGSDTISGGAGADRIYFNNTSKQDLDVVDGGAGADTIFMDSGDFGHGRISGGAGKDQLMGKGYLGGYAVDGVETLILRGNVTADADMFDSFSKIDSFDNWDNATTSWKLTLSSGGEFTWKAASKYIEGTLVGSADIDVIDFGKSGQNWSFDLGKGDDVLTASRGHDAFYFEKGDGHDVLNKFDSFESDTLHIRRSAAIRSFDDLEGRILTQGDNVLIVLDKTVADHVEDMHDVIELTHVKASTLSKWDFEFFGR
jgi:Ca2+-binding RTX toxin-like protein